MLVEIGRAADSLARIVDNEVQSLLRRQYFLAEGFDARRMPKVEAVDLEAVGPLGEIRFASIAGGRVARESCSDNQTRAGSKEFDACLVADFHASPGEQRDAATQVCELGAFRKILLGAGDA